MPIFNPLMPLHGTGNRNIPLVCVPGAGASVTSFLDFVGSLGEGWPVYGLQPRGIDSAETPHATVEAAAICNLNALSELKRPGSVHLLGHSHGGFVAFEMARQLQERGRLVASLTLIDCEPPDPPGRALQEVDDAQIRREFVDIFENTYERRLDIAGGCIASTSVQGFLRELHAALSRSKCWSGRGGADILLGPLATYAAARRNIYVPPSGYSGKVHLVLVRERCMKDTEDVKLRSVYADKWQRYVAELNVWSGPGNHFSVLQPPNVQSVASWWRNAIEQ